MYLRSVMPTDSLPQMAHDIEMVRPALTAVAPHDADSVRGHPGPGAAVRPTAELVGVFPSHDLSV